MRIGLTGVTATGKTSLASHFHDQYGYVRVEEGFKDLVNALELMGRLPSQANIEAALSCTGRWLGERSEILARNADVVMDRTAIDALKFWLDFLSPRMPHAPFQRVCELAAPQLARLDRLVVTPMEEASQDESRNEAGLLRRSSPIVRTRSHVVMLGLAQWLAGGRLLVLPPCKTTEERARIILDSDTARTSRA